MKTHTHIIDEQLWTDIEAVFAANRPTRDEAEWEALTREVSDGELEAAKATAVEGVERKSVRHKRAWWSAIAAAAVFVIVAGLGVVFYQMKAPSDLTANVSPTSGTHESHQWDSRVPPVGHADSSSHISPLDQSQPETRLSENANTSIRKRQHVYRKLKKHIDVSDSQPVLVVDEPAEEAIVDQGIELYAQHVQSIRQRGERLRDMLDAAIENENIEN